MLATALSRLVTAAFITGLVGACSRSPAPLVNGLIEGMDESAVIAKLGVPKTAVRIVHETTLPKGDTRPPYSEKTIAVIGGSCEGQPAEMSISFYLGHLREVTCYPQDADAMLQELAKAGIIEGGKRAFKVTRGEVSVRGGESDGRWGVTFSSEHLTDQQQSWIAKYS
ncbi:MAG: hypothetical protein JWO04_3547 [Gammaproteobacteria bacterium]|nr:hypothetical protein [Gammaproteobacteria bacterium]